MDATLRPAEFVLPIATPGAPLSGPEQEIAATMDREADEQRRRRAARAVLRIGLADISFAELCADPTRGEIAGRLLATWAPYNVAEPVTEAAYFHAGLQQDLQAAMKAHGLPTFAERCAEIGRRLTEDAIAYVLRCHEGDAEAIAEDWNAEQELERDSRLAAAEEAADARRELA